MKTEIQKLYEKIPASQCKEGCFLCCSNLVQFAPEELERAGCYIYDGKCNHLGEHGCTIYENRPFVCRIFGTSALFSCEDCHPEVLLSEEESRELVKEYVRLKDQQEKTNRHNK